MGDPTAKLLVKVETDTKALKTGLDAADKRMGGFANNIKKHHRAIGVAMTAVGAAILTTAALSVKQFASMGDEVHKMALRTGFSTEALSELRHAAQLSGTSLAGVEKASRTLSGAILDAGFGLETYVRAFDQLGLSYEQLRVLSPEEQFIAVLEALADLSDESARAALAADLFGRAGTSLLPMLEDGAEGLREMRQGAHDLGTVFDKEAALKAALFNNALTNLKGSVNGVMIEVGSFLVDALKPLIDNVTEAIKKFSAWSDEHPGLAKAITLTAVAIGGLLVVLGPLLIVLPQLTAAYKILAAVKWSAIIPAIWAHVTALWAQVTATLAALAATGLLIPAAIAAVAAIGLITTGIILLVKNQKEQFESTTAVVEATDELAESTARVTEETAMAAEETKKLNREVQALTGSFKDAVVGAFLYYSTLGRDLTPFEAEQRRALGGVIGIPGLAHGGIVTSPTLAMVGENGPEAVVPLNQMGGLTINFNEPVFMEKEESINKLADRIYRVIKRDQRFSFGAARG